MLTTSTPDELREDVLRAYPAMAAHPDLVASAVRLLALAESADQESGAADDYAAILAAAEATARTATVHGMTHGDRSELRSVHAWPIGADLPMDPVAVATRAVDAWREASRSDVVTRRTKRGTVRRVRRYGRSFAIGDTATDEVTHPRPYPLDETLAALPRRPFGVDGMALARITSAAYGLDLLGGEFRSWSEVLPADVSHLLASGPYSYAAHTTGQYRTTNERAAVPYRTRYRTTFKRRRNDPDGLCTAGDTVAIRREVHGTVERDDRGRVVYRVPDRTAVRSGPCERLHVGNVTVQRTRAKGTRGARSARLSERIILPPKIKTAAAAMALTAALRDVPRGSAVEVLSADRTVRATVTRSGSSRWSATVHGADVAPIKGNRAPTGIVRRIAPALTA